MKKFRVAHLYYDLMNLYGENGNIRFLKKKLDEQGIDSEIYFLSLEDKIDFDKYDFYYIGMGSLENQEIVLNNLIKYKDKVIEAINKDKFFLVTGNAIDLFGMTLTKGSGKVLKGLETFNYEALEEEFRIVGPQYYETDLIPQKIIGFQNRNSLIKNANESMFRVIDGTGFNPKEKVEGIHYNNFYGTYLIGPLLVRNPYFCDYLVKEICNYMNIEYKKVKTNNYAYKAYEEYIKNFYTK